MKTDIGYRNAKYRQLPLGAVTAEGWLKEQLTRNRDGMGGHLPELEPRMIATPYTTRETEPRWGEERAPGWGAEISGSYWTGLVELAFTLNDEGLKHKAEEWVNAVLRNQRPDGYMGTYTEKDNLFDDYNAWGTAMGMNAMLAYYSATGREDVLEAVHRCLLWFCENWAGNRKTSYAGVAIVGPMSECYRYTGDERLARFGEEYYDFLEHHDLFEKSLGAYLRPRLHYNANHGAGYAEAMSHPMDVYLMNGDRRYYDASVNAYAKAEGKVLQKTGGITCESEYIAPLGANVETEYCAITMLAYSLERMMLPTGDVSYGDMIERAVFNAGEGARKKDERAIAYLHSPNQIFATDHSSTRWRHHQVYAPCVPVACCPVMSVRLLPEMLRGAVLSDREDGLWFALYVPLRVSSGGLTVRLTTAYPFGDTLRFCITADTPVTKKLHFRIPGWCSGATLSANGTSRTAEAGTWAEMEGTWQNGDEIVLTLPMQVRIGQVDDSDRRATYPVTLEYGPLLFALPIPERWQPYPGVPYTPVPEDFPWYRVKPVIPRSELDIYDDMGRQREMIGWNVALEDSLKAEDVRVETTPLEGYPWEKPNITLRVPARKAPYSYPPYPMKTQEPYGDGGRVYVTDRLELTLVPFGCTALRIAYFPRAELSEE